MKPESNLESLYKTAIWVGNLRGFIVNANRKTWAADAAEVPSQRPGYKELQWPYPIMSKSDLEEYQGWEDWLLRDSYTGYFRAPGMTTVYYKGKPAWTMQYGGHGQMEGYETQAKQTFQFLREALKRVSLILLIRGPEEFIQDNKRYNFTLLQGDFMDCLWREEIF